HLSESRTDSMIDICYRDDPTEGAFGHAAFVHQLEQAGASLQRVAAPTSTNVCVFFGSLEDDVMAKLAPDVRRRVVLVAEGATPDAASAESTRSAHELLGIVEPSAWRNWKRGLYVAWGLFGREDIATAAGLKPIDTRGLQLANDTISLPSLVARFVITADNIAQKR
ncbi:MAG TPA: hypothetical protein VMJ10_18805, partial [Kofleriaceae bacterium]|nr:hypothetical protein [Kofleriaceae bacterium]